MIQQFKKNHMSPFQKIWRQSVFFLRNTGVNKTHLLKCPKVLAYVYIFNHYYKYETQYNFTLQKMDYFSRTKIP